MSFDSTVVYLGCVLIVGLIGWMLKHTVDRRIHLSGRPVVSEEVFLAKLSSLEDRLRAEIIAVKIKLEELERFTLRVDDRLEKLMNHRVKVVDKIDEKT